MIKSRLQRIVELADAGLISAREAARLLEIPLDDNARDHGGWMDRIALWSKSKLGQTWEVRQPFVFNVQPSGDAFITNNGLAAYQVNGAPHAMEPGDLLLVVAERVGVTAQTLLHLTSGHTFVASGWQYYSELHDSSAD